MKQCKKILVDFPDLDLNEFVDSQKSNEYLTESFTEIISHSTPEPDEEEPETSSMMPFSRKSSNTMKNNVFF